MTGVRTPELSIVVCGRNDDYGETFKARFQTFLRHLGALGDAHKDLFELVVVEWNPPTDAQPLAMAFDWTGLDEIARIVTVPPEAHAAIPNPGGMPLLEFWSKNVGVRRSRAPYILSTNPDIVLAPAFFDFVQSGELSPQAFYRADRYDFAPQLAFEAPGDRIFALAQQAVFEAHTRNPIDPEEPMSHLVDPGAPIDFWPQSQPVYGDTLRDNGAIIVSGKRRDPLSGLHTQASGDFVMASRQAWEAVRGHWERTDTFTHIDSYLVCHLHAAGYRQHILRRPIMVLHMDHTREEQKSRPMRPFSETFGEFQAAAAGELPNPNDQNWGLADLDLPEARPTRHAAAPRSPAAAAASSISLASHLQQLARAQALAAAQRVTDLRKQSALERQIMDLRAQLDSAVAASRDQAPPIEATQPGSDTLAPHDAPDDANQHRELESRLAEAESCRAATTSVLEHVSRERDELQTALSAERAISAETLAQVDALARSIAQLQNDVEVAHNALRDATASHAAERAVADARYDELARQLQYLRTEELAQIRAAHEQRVSQLRAEADDAHTALNQANVAHAAERAVADARYDELARQMAILRAEELAQLRAAHAEQSAQLRQALHDAERIAQQLDADRDLHMKAAARAFQDLETERTARLQEAERTERLLAAERDLAAAQQRAIQELQGRREAAEGLARALEHEGIAREQRVAALESALAGAQQAAAEAEAARDAALATYKAIVDNSRYLKARRAIIRLLKGSG